MYILPKLELLTPHWVTVSLALALFVCPAALRSDDGPGWGHLIFSEATNPVVAVADSENERGKSEAILVYPEDLRVLDHRGNSILADVSFLEYASGGEAQFGAGEGKQETLLIVASGTAEIQIGSFKSVVESEDMILVPSEYTFEAKVIGDDPLRLVRAVWKDEGSMPSASVNPVIRSESRNPFDYYNEGGYISVSPDSRQEDTGLAIVGVGGHTRLSASLLFYSEDLESRNNFKANVKVSYRALNNIWKPAG